MSKRVKFTLAILTALAAIAVTAPIATAGPHDGADRPISGY